MFGKADQDEAVHSRRRTRIVLDAAEQVASNEGLSFLDMDLDTKKLWLNDRMKVVLDRAIHLGGPDFENLKHFRVFVVENQGAAVLYFERIK